MITLVFDTETTGLPPHPNARPSARPRNIEWAGALVNSQGEILEEMGMLINPEVVPENLARDSNLIDRAKIMKISGIDTDELGCELIFAEAAPLIRPFFAKADQLIAHNLPFDMEMMRMDLERCGIKDWPWPKILTCTAAEHQEEWGRRPKLIHLYEHYTGTPLNQTHRALDDVHALIEVCKHSGVLS